jgi:beta-phosphoglucomutase-like phosphatase (HAD superfamily)
VAELVIFDCDGVLVDSDRISLRIQAERISALGLEMSYEDCVREFLGLGRRRRWKSSPSAWGSRCRKGGRRSSMQPSAKPFGANCSP